MQKIINRPEDMNHPLYCLLVDCIAASTGGATSQLLGRAMKISGWQHNFVGYDEMGFSLEELVFTDRAFKELVDLVKKMFN